MSMRSTVCDKFRFQTASNVAPVGWARAEKENDVLCATSPYDWLALLTRRIASAKNHIAKKVNEMVGNWIQATNAVQIYTQASGTRSSGKRGRSSSQHPLTVADSDK